MADKKVEVTTEDNITTETYTVKKDFWTTYSKPIIYAGSAIILILGAWFGYQKLVKEPKEQKSAEMIFPAESFADKVAATGFGKDSVNTILNGGSVEGANIPGLLKVISNYKGTASANRAMYLVGASYLHIGEFDKAIKYLKDFDANGATQIDIKRNMMIGHAYAEQKKSDDALSYYKKAAGINEKDEAYTADALIIAAAYAERIGKTGDAVELYIKARDKYPNVQAVQSGDVEKHLAKLGTLK
jgi:tetratricopeptide (TPR) repeat protein